VNNNSSLPKPKPFPFRHEAEGEIKYQKKLKYRERNSALSKLEMTVKNRFAERVKKRREFRMSLFMYVRLFLFSPFRLEVHTSW
jgi:hypothetical protein